MIHAYDKLYLSVAQKNLACMLDYMVNDLKRPLETVWQWFCMSNTCLLYTSPSPRDTR